MTGVLAAVAVLVAVLLAIELSLRYRGFGSFPLFEHAEGSVYRMRPNQAGRFRRRHVWRYDANGMRNDQAPSSFAGTTLLIGDSIVDGGLRIDQAETLAAVAARLNGESFYTVACHGWALANSVAALTALPGWVGAKRLVFVLNTGDFDTINEMGSELSFPTRRPVWLTSWLVRRQALRRFRFYRRARAESQGIASQAVDRDLELRATNLAAFRDLLAKYAGPVLLVRYPLRGENARAERYFEQLKSLDPRVQLLDVMNVQGWSNDCYADHIHPNVRGLELLAGHLCAGLS